jgi:hypothetical protein
MKFVRIELQFVTPCLGNSSQGSDRNGQLCHQRDGAGNVVFLQSWWSRAIVHAAAGYGKYQEDVKAIRWAPVVLGELSIHRRYYQAKRYRKHESFDTGTHVHVRASIPESIPVDEFKKILAYAGEFYGISPWGWYGEDENTSVTKERGYGRFKVVKIEEARYDPH